MTEPHETLLKFGYPGSLIAEYAHWAVMLRNEQPTLGCLVLSVKGDYRRMPAVPAEAFAELPRVTGDIEAALQKAFSFDKINWLVLMMRDPQVHFHVIPRYAAPRDFLGRGFADPGWPKTPALFTLLALDQTELAELKAHILGCWPKG
ncbi:MAG: HIT family protein [Alphaproteobacteria bacterium]|nr:HIT family protein [Alphaproteobacteria bacterium]